MPHDARSSTRSAAPRASGRNRRRSTPLPRCRNLRPATRWRRLITSTSSTFWTNSTSDQHAANASSEYTSARRRSRSCGVTYRPWTVLTTIGTPARRPTTRPYTPGLGLCVCSTVGRSRRKIRHSSVAARTSAHGFQSRVDAASVTCRTPCRSIAVTNGPGALIPIASPPAATTASSWAPRSSARLMSTVVT